MISNVKGKIGWKKVGSNISSTNFISRVLKSIQDQDLNLMLAIQTTIQSTTKDFPR